MNPEVFTIFSMIAWPSLALCGYIICTMNSGTIITVPKGINYFSPDPVEWVRMFKQSGVMLSDSGPAASMSVREVRKPITKIRKDSVCHIEEFDRFKEDIVRRATHEMVDEVIAKGLLGLKIKDGREPMNMMRPEEVKIRTELKIVEP